MRRSFIIVVFLVLLSSSNYKEEDIKSLWIAEDYPSYFSVYTFKSGKASYYAANNEYATHKFSIEDNAVSLEDIKSNFL
jgi:hypothetical protein